MASVHYEQKLKDKTVYINILIFVWIFLSRGHLSYYMENMAYIFRNNRLDNATIFFHPILRKKILLLLLYCVHNYLLYNKL